VAPGLVSKFADAFAFSEYARGLKDASLSEEARQQ